MGTLPPLQVQSEILQGAKKKKRLRTEPPTNDPYPNPTLTFSHSPRAASPRFTVIPGQKADRKLGALKFLESSVQHYSVFSSPFPRAFAYHNSHGVNPSEFGE